MVCPCTPVLIHLSQYKYNMHVGLSFCLPCLSPLDHEGLHAPRRLFSSYDAANCLASGETKRAKCVNRLLRRGGEGEEVSKQPLWRLTH